MAKTKKKELEKKKKDRTREDCGCVRSQGRVEREHAREERKHSLAHVVELL
jgi:hypothetical protein